MASIFKDKGEKGIPGKGIICRPRGAPLTGIRVRPKGAGVSGPAWSLGFPQGQEGAVPGSGVTWLRA